MLTHKDYCDYEACVALREMGYDGYCAAYYHLFDNDDDARNSFEYAYGFDFQNSNNIYRVGAPLLYQAQKWLREEKQSEIVVHSFDYVGEPYFADIHMYREVRCACSYADSYEEALLEGIKEAVKILKENETIHE